MEPEGVRGPKVNAGLRCSSEAVEVDASENGNRENSISRTQGRKIDLEQDFYEDYCVVEKNSSVTPLDDWVELEEVSNETGSIGSWEEVTIKIRKAAKFQETPEDSKSSCKVPASPEGKKGENQAVVTVGDQGETQDYTPLKRKVSLPRQNSLNPADKLEENSQSPKDISRLCHVRRPTWSCNPLFRRLLHEMRLNERVADVAPSLKEIVSMDSETQKEVLKGLGVRRVEHRRRLVQRFKLLKTAGPYARMFGFTRPN